MSHSKNPQCLYCISIDWFRYDRSPFLRTGTQEQIDHYVCLEIPFNENLHYIKTSQKQVSTETHFRI